MNHKALECNSKSLKCPLCMDVNKDCSNYCLGGLGCVCPSFFVNQTTTTFTSDSSRTTGKDNSYYRSLERLNSDDNPQSTPDIVKQEVESETDNININPSVERKTDDSNPL